MKKKFLFSILMLTFFSGQAAFAQIIANNDTMFFNGTSGQAAPYYGTALVNDTLNGIPYIYQLVTNSQVSTSNANVQFVNGYVSVVPGTAAGTYTIVYQICEIGNPNNCDTATITVNVCNIDAPVIAQQTCASSSDSLLVSGLPATGTWTLSYYAGWGSTPVTINGTGTSYLVTNLSPNYYVFKVSNSSCVSSEVGVSVGYLSGGLGVEMTGTYVDSNSDGVPSIGDVINYNYAIHDSLNCPLTNVQVGETQQVISGSPIASIAPGTTDNSITGVYVLQQSDISNGSVTQWSSVSATSNGHQVYIKAFCTVPLSISDGITLNAFLDDNNNGILDAGEETTPNVGYFNVTLNNGAIHNLANYSGGYTFYETNPANSYDFSFTPYSYGCGGTFQSTAVYNNVTVAAGSGITVYNFPITTTSCTEVGVNLYASTARPGGSYHAYFYYGNYGNQPVAAGTVTFTKDPLVTIASVSEPGVVMNATGFTYNFTNLQPYESRYIEIDMDVPPMPTVNLGDYLLSTAAIDIPGGDYTASNNIDTFNSLVVNSYDPNDITESHGKQIKVADFSAADYLTYTIRFENTGTAEAIDISVTDVLDSQLDASTVRMVDATGNYVMERTGNNLEWRFNGINLPPSVEGTETGKGYIVFKVKPLSYAVGDIIPNKANIYFDSNPAIETNEFETEFVSVLKTDEFEADALSVYPNPTKNVVNISFRDTTIETIQVNDMLGKIIMTKTVGNKNTQIDLSPFSKGLYFAKVTTAGGSEKTFKIIKQ